jgi:DNA-binding LacI/PurR family transcriptional regulator
VSRVLREVPGTSDAARSAVAAALRGLGVEPSADGAARPDGPLLVGVVSNLLEDPDIDHYGTVALALNREIFARGHIAVSVTAAEDLDPVESCVSRGIAGVIVLGGAEAGRLAPRLAEAGIPVVRISNAPHSGLPQFVLDASTGIETAVRHLVHMGHRRIGFAVMQNSAAESRAHVFRQAVSQMLHVQATRTEAPVEFAREGQHAGIHAAEVLLAQGITAAITTSPALALGFFEATAQARLQMPRDLSLLTVGDLQDADVLSPPMSQVTYDWVRLAESAVAELTRVVDQRAAGATEAAAHYRVVPELVLRASIRPVTRR